ncbi:hypothetical protein BSQ44_06845 [Aquibium oceanicum]|uniref:Uncharacterized protein n=2 Tax=Aquibium oceanicum TaxID=1670800 RepID=A0A1L3SNZ8_9HYPH|nr:hypothetical protein BSQ44_06845 [Aquibium oceanicum]
MQQLANEAARVANLASKYRDSVGPLFLSMVSAFAQVLAHFPVEDGPTIGINIEGNLLTVSFESDRRPEVFRVSKRDRTRGEDGDGELVIERVSVGEGSEVRQ